MTRRTQTEDTRGFLVRTERPWEALPPDMMRALEPLLPEVTEEIIATIANEIPEYQRPLTETVFGETVRNGVTQALGQFARMVAEPGGVTRGAERAVYVALGRGEHNSGRSMESLLAAYRIGARVAWRRLAAGGVAAGIEQEHLNRLAEAIFVYIDELSAESAEGWARARADAAGEIDRRRSELIELLVAGGTLDAVTLESAAELARWRLPAELAVLVWRIEDGRSLTGRLPSDSIVTATGDEFQALVPDPAGPGRRAELDRAFAGVAAGLGTAMAPERTRASLRHARSALALARREPEPRLVVADDELAELMSRADLALVEQVVKRRLRVLEDETPAAQRRLKATLLSWLRHHGSVSAVAAELGVHHQTVRYRLARLQELFDEQLDDPDARFELEIALRATAGA